MTSIVKPSFLDIESLAARIIQASRRIEDLVIRTSVEDISDLFPGGSTKVFAKLENLQETGSFKLRGATNKILSLADDERVRGVTTASNGNHGLGVSLAAKRVGIHAEVFVSDEVGPEKAKRIESYGASVRRGGERPLDAEIAARQEALESGKIYISPYNDWDVVSGQGTVAVELLEQITYIDAVFVTVGGGGLISGIGAYLKHASPNTEVVGCWPENSRVLYESIKMDRILEFPEQSTFSENTTGGIEPGSITFEIARAVVDSFVLVTEAEILEAMRLMHAQRGWLIEGAAAVALAAFIKTQPGIKAKQSPS